MLNKVILMGRLCADPDFRQTQSGIAVCRIRVAIDRPYTSKSTGERRLILSMLFAGGSRRNL